jgi:AmiR/NasT family two-component response regulator
MEPLSLVIYHNDPGTAQALVVGLSQYFDPVNSANKYDEVRAAVVRHRADVLVLNLEASQTDEIGRLHQEFPSLCIVATHRLADEDLWTEAMNKGAADVCEPRNDEIVRSVLRGRAHRAAA